MKAMRVVIVLAIGVLVASVAFAQRGPQGEGRGGRGEQGGKGGPGMMDGILSQLNLDEKQQAAVDKLREEMKTAMENAKGNKDAQKTAWQAFQSKVMEILTPEQKKKFEDLKAQHRQQQRRRQGGGGGAQ
jgi:Spy/CpxP family protein refolding chaperone